MKQFAGFVLFGQQLSDFAFGRRREMLSRVLPCMWELLSRTDRNAGCDLVPEPLLGSDQVALLMYDRSRHFHVEKK
ncbi:MAG: hypothetical protein WBX15_12270 [Thermoanaerobaculia bacterium]